MKVKILVEKEINYTVSKYDRSHLLTETCRFPRKDIFLIQWFGACNVFVELDGSYQIDLWDKSTIVDYEEIKKVVNKVIVENPNHITKQKVFIDTFNNRNK